MAKHLFIADNHMAKWKRLGVSRMLEKQSHKLDMRVILVSDYRPSPLKRKNIFVRIRCKHDFDYQGLGAGGKHKVFLCSKCRKVRLI